MDLCKEFGVALLIVACITWIWNLMGGDPLTDQLDRITTTLAKFEVVDQQLSTLTAEVASLESVVGKLDALDKQVTLITDHVGSLESIVGKLNVLDVQVAQITAQVDSLKSVIGLVGDSYSTGIRRVFENPKTNEVNWSILIRNAETCIDFSGYALLHLAESKELQSLIIARANAGVVIRLAIYDRTNLAIQSGTFNPKSVKDSIDATNQVFIAMKKSVTTGKLTTYSVVANTIFASIFRCDDKMVIAQLYKFLS